MRLLKTNLIEIDPPEVATGSSYLTRAQLFNLSAPTHSAPTDLRAESIDPLRGNAWDSAVSEHPEATIFHSSAWARVLADTYGHRPEYVRFSEGGKLLALLPMMELKSSVTGRRGVCLPFSDFCGPLFFADRAAAPVVDHVANLARERRWKFFELRCPLPPDVAVSVHQKFYGHRLDLTKSPEDLFEASDSSARRALRKAERSGIAVEVTSGAKALPEFYRLHSATRRRHGIPPQPFAFFRNIQQHIMERGLGFVVTARLDARLIAAALFFHFRGQALFKFGASDERRQERRPNNLVMWEGIKHATQLGARSLHLGRTDFEHAGLRRFKLSLGAEEEMLNYLRFDTVKARWMNEEPAHTSVLAAALFRRLPLTVNQLAGTVLYPHLH